jgi:hypothetical protein
MDEENVRDLVLHTLGAHLLGGTRVAQVNGVTIVDTFRTANPGELDVQLSNGEFYKLAVTRTA